MQIGLKIFLTLILLSFLFSCNKEKCNCAESDFIGKWQAETFMSIESAGYPKNNEYFPLIEFKNDGTFTLSLDVNSCGGSYVLSGENFIGLSEVACTEICCDSPFSQKFAETLARVTSYSFEGQTLKLNVPEWGWIQLSRFSD